MRRSSVLCAALLGTVCGACGDRGGDEAFSRSQTDAAIAVTLRDFAFDGLPPSVTGAKVFVTAVNAGPSEHELEILDATGETVDEIEAFATGAKAKTLALKLRPGMHTVQCILTTPDGKVHADLGMRAQLQVR